MSAERSGGARRVAFVVQRYGLEVAGGAEALCRDTARALAAAGIDVTVLTTTARDYIDWQPWYPPGDVVEEGVRVRRFAVDPPDPPRGARVARDLRFRGADRASEREWAIAQGPVSPDLLRALAGERFDVVVSWTYLYATSQLAVALAPARSVLVPLAHEEPFLRFDVSRGLLATASGLAFMTPEERDLVGTVCPLGGRPEALVGTGVASPPDVDVEEVRARLALPSRFALAIGRVDLAKGVGGLVRAHSAYRDAGGALDLVVAGRATSGVQLPNGTILTGFVDAATRDALISAAEVVVLPSALESLSLVALESWRAGTPTLATAHSPVLAGQTARSGGGLLYTGPRTYATQLARLAGDPDLRARLGAAGRAWVAGQTWDACVGRWRGLLDAVAALPA